MNSVLYYDWLGQVVFAAHLLPVATVGCSQHWDRLSNGSGTEYSVCLVQAMIAQIFITMNLLYTFWSGDWSKIWQRYTVVHQYCFVVLLLVRVILLYFVLMTRFWNRHSVVRLINGYRRLAQKRRQVVHLWRRRVISKCLSIALIELLQVFVVISLVWNFNFPIVPCLVLCLWTWSTSSFILHISMLSYT